MVRGNMLRRGWLVAGVALGLMGCPPPAVDCNETTITFDTPTAGQTVDSPFDVAFSVTAPDGSPFKIDSAKLRVGSESVDSTDIATNRATFTGLTTTGEVKLTPVIAAGSCTKTGVPITVTVRSTACTTPAVTAVEFPQDVAPLGVLNRRELPDGTFLQVKVSASCVAEGVQVRIKRGADVVGPLTAFVNGVATVTTSLPDSDSARLDLFAELVQGGVAVNTVSGNPAASASVQVSRALPACAVTTTGTFGPMADADTNTAGFQMRVTGTMAVGSTGLLGLTGQTPVAVSPSMTGDVSQDFTLATSGDYTATLTCTDAAGNTNTATGTFSVDFEPPTVSITSPANVDGGATMQVTASPLAVVVATSAEDGSIAKIARNGTDTDTEVVMGGAVTLQVPFGMDGTFTLVVTVTDTAGNIGSATVTVVVVLDGCGAVFTRPGACPALITPAQLSNGAYSFQTSSKATCAGQPAELFRATVLADGGLGAETSAATSTIGASGSAAFPAVTLVSGDYVFRGVITNPGPDAGVSETVCATSVDLDGPVITSPLVPTGQTSVTINAAQDSDGNVSGAQRGLSFSARVPLGGRVDVCTTQALNPYLPASDGGFTTRPTSPECGAGWYLLQQGVTSPLSGFTFPDGQYEIKVVVVGGGLATAPSSPPIPVTVDTVRPCLSNLRLPQDTNNDLRLSIAELDGGQPQLAFSLDCGDTSPATLAATSPVTIRDVVAGSVSGARASTVTFANGSYTVTLTDSYAAEVNLSLFVELADQVSNRNSLTLPPNRPATIDFRVDPVAPSCSITSPTAALMGAAQVPGGNLDVLVATSTDVGTGGVSVSFTGQTARTLNASLGQAQTTYTLTGDNSYTIDATCTDAAGNASVATTRTTRVDLVPPTCGITAPVNNSTSSVNAVTTTVAVTGVSNGDVVTVSSSVAGISNNLLTVSGTSASGVVTYPNGTQTVTVAISDAAGNPCVAPTNGTSQVTLTVNSATCSLDFAGAGAVITNANGNWINRASANNTAGTSPFSVSLGAVTSDCGAGRNVYLYQGAPSATPSGTPQVTNSSGAVTFAGTSVSDGQQWTITIDNGTGLLTHRSFTVSFAAPTIGGIALQRSSADTTMVSVAPNAALIFGAASGNRRVETATGTDMVFGDLDQVTANAQFQLALSNIDGARVGTLNATLDVLEGSTALMPTVSVNASAFTPTLPRMVLGHRADDTTTTLVIRVTSPAGNVATSTHSAQVDVIAPGAVSLGQSISSPRAATAALSWDPSYDDGTDSASGGLTGGSPAAGYDLRWTTDLVAPTGIPDVATYFNSTFVNADALVAWQSGQINYGLTLPPINNYHIAVLARDEVGNYSTFAAPTRLNNRGTEDVILNPTATASQRFGGVLAGPDIRLAVATRLADGGVVDGGQLDDGGYGFTSGIGSVNSDLIDDLLVAASNRPVVHDGGYRMPDGGTVTTGSSMANAGAVYVYYGRSGFGSATTCTLPNCQEIVPYQSQASAFFGFEASMGNVDNEGKDPNGRLDLLVSSPNYDGNRGRVFLYFGSSTSTSIDTNTFVEFRGQDYNSRLGGIAKVVPDINGDGINEVLIASRTEPLTGPNAGQGIMYLYFGRTQAQWLALMASVDGVTGKSFVVVNATTASRVLEGPLPVDNTGSASNLWGSTRGIFSPLGDLNNDAVQDFAISANKNTINRSYFYSGAAVVAATAAIPAPTTFVDELDKGTSGVATGFGIRTLGGYNITGASAPDFVATQARLSGGSPVTAASCNVKVFPDITISGTSATPLTISGSATRGFGAWAEVADVNADGRYDLVVGESGSSSTTAWVFFQRVDRQFDAVAGAGFWQAGFVGPAASRRGSSVAQGDFDGDGKVDLAIGDDIDSPGRIIVWH